jgi:hypothetical protein
LECGTPNTSRVQIRPNVNMIRSDAGGRVRPLLGVMFINLIGV